MSQCSSLIRETKGDGLIRETDDPSFDMRYVLRFKRFDEMHCVEVWKLVDARLQMQKRLNAFRLGDKFIERNLIGAMLRGNTTDIFLFRIVI